MSKQTIKALTKKDYASDQDVRWCPGCGDYSILAQMQKVLADMQIPKHEVVFVSGIGCSSRFPYYMDTYGFHGIHGRAPTIATGLKAVSPELNVFVITGDGDGLSIGGNHLLHAMRRNIDINIILFNNQIYGLTKGQYSPTSEFGKKTKSSPLGNIDTPIRPISFALAAEASFVARSFDRDPKHLQMVLKRALSHRGTSFIEIYQNCNIFNDGAFDRFTDKSHRAERMLYLEHDKAMVFGSEEENAIILDGLKPKVVKRESIKDETILVHDESFEDQTLALLLDRMVHPDFPVPVGVFRSVDKAVYGEMIQNQISSAKNDKGDGDLKALYRRGDTWTVS